MTSRQGRYEIAFTEAVEVATDLGASRTEGEAVLATKQWNAGDRVERLQAFSVAVGPGEPVAHERR